MQTAARKHRQYISINCGERRLDDHQYISIICGDAPVHLGSPSVNHGDGLGRMETAAILLT
jgi:hypothetical protein